ncbi:hypothetical protein [Halosolutus gelatinilyticus]|uniref:hypothetical protein n=1 Tax=Halosolutus gelatinilyticus TaxID=2931975 RepID=UPI001FF3B984|nr:hypothetical protein [Halosolutus gelatinilyticus]
MIDRVDDSLSDALDWLQDVGLPDRVASDDSSGDGANEDEVRLPVVDAADDRSSDGDGDESDDADTGTNDGTGGWGAAESPTSRALHAVVHGHDGPYACGEGGLLLHRGDDGWQVVLERGPGVSENTLRDVAATDDGCRLWFAGDSGALGCYDVVDGRLSDYSAPMEKTSTWEAIAVTGSTGEERVRIANGSGEVLDCTVEDGCPTWGDVVEPGGGSTVPGLTAGPDGFCAVDTSGGAYRESADRDENGESTSDTESTSSDRWERIGVRNAQVDFQDIWAGDGAVYIAGADGIAYRYDPDCENWTPLHVGQGALQAIQARGTGAVAVATGGRIYRREESVRWAELDTPTEQSLQGLALARSSDDVDGGLATSPVDVAVGAGGVILERDRSP